MSKADWVIDQVADAIVSINQECIASAATTFALSVDGARRVDITGVVIEGKISSGVKTCKSNRDVDIGAMTKKRLAGGIQDQQQITRISDVIQKSLSVDVMTRCVAIATSSIVLRMANIRRNVVIKNLHVRQAARASVAKCIQNVTVRIGNSTKPLRAYLEDELRDESLSACPSEQRELRILTIVGASSASVLLVTLITLLGVAQWIKRSR